MFPDEECLRTGERDNFRAEQTEFAVADHGHAIVFRDRDALEDAAGRGEWFDKSSVLVRNVVRNGQQVDVGQLQKLSVRAVAAVNSQNRACWTVTRIACATEFALSAAGVDLADHATSDEISGRAFFNYADKLVTDRSVETGVTARDFEISVADA